MAELITRKHCYAIFPAVINILVKVMWYSTLYSAKLICLYCKINHSEHFTLCHYIHGAYTY